MKKGFFLLLLAMGALICNAQTFQGSTSSDYDKRINLNEGYVKVRKNNKFGILNQEGKEIVPCVYDSVVDFKEGLAMVGKAEAVYLKSSRESGFIYKYGFVDMQGNEVIPCVLDDVGYFHEGLAIVGKSEDTGVVSKNGKAVIGAVEFILNDTSRVYLGNVKHGIIDKKGNEVVPYVYNVIRQHFKEGYAIVGKGDEEWDNKFGIINRDGREICPCIYDEIKSFHEDLACVMKNDKYGYINKNGEVVIPIIYDSAGDFHEGTAEVSNNGTFFLIDKQGRRIE